MKKFFLAAAFVGCVYAANWTLARYGMVEIPVIGWLAPAGVLWAGFSFGIRDALREAAGDSWRVWVVGAIAAGTAVSYVLGDAITIPGGALTIAASSGIAFGLSELADACVYEPLRKRQWVVAVFISNLVGAVVDSLIFLSLAFGATDAIGGQVLGKALVILPALPIVYWARGRHAR